MARAASPVRLSPETLRAFTAYIRAAEMEMKNTLTNSLHFLSLDGNPALAAQVRRGEIVASFCSGRGPAKIANGLIHDWVGAVFIPGATIRTTLALIQDYNQHKVIYAPDVMDSRLLNRRGNRFQVYLRLLKKKVITVILDSEHDVIYRRLDRTRSLCRSRTTRIAEVQNAGSADEKPLPPDTGHGFLWRLYSYWRFREESDGVFAECRAISLTRDVPFGLGWVIEPIIQNLPRETLIRTLAATRQALC